MSEESDQQVFESKQAAREAVWSRLAEAGAARFPLPPHRRIPNFDGARQAAERLLALAPFSRMRHIKVNPDAPQRPVRELALRRGITVYVPSARLRSGFKRLDPANIPDDRIREAASLTRGERWAEYVRLDELPRMDLIVTGSVAVTPDGRRCGKGHGYGDLEYAILRELGHPATPVATTVHPLQLVESVPSDPHDLPVWMIATPDEVMHVKDPQEPPAGVDWKLITDEMRDEMQVLRELEEWKSERR